MKSIMTPSIAICIALSGCVTPNQETSAPQERRLVQNGQEEEVVDPCPQLPRLAKGASLADARLWTLTVVALYEQCANSKAPP